MKPETVEIKPSEKAAFFSGAEIKERVVWFLASALQLGVPMAELDHEFSSEGMPKFKARAVRALWEFYMNAAARERGEAPAPDALTQREGRLLAALQPFAALASLFEPGSGTVPTSGPIYQWSRNGTEYALTIEHLRAAREALGNNWVKDAPTMNDDPEHDAT